MKTGDAIRAILKVSGWNQSRLADHLGVTQPTVSRWIKGSEPNGQQFQSIQDLYKEVAAPLPKVTAPQDIASPGLPQLDIHAGMGNGGLAHIEVDQDHRPLPEYTKGDWQFPSDVQTQIGSFKGKFAFPVTGDSMSPTIEGGTIVFVDTKQNYPSPPGLFVIDTGDGLLVKRVELIPGTDKIRIISDNPTYGDYEFLREEVHVYGRIFGCFKWIG